MLPDMSDDILNTIEVLTNKVRAKEEEANKLKKLINELCTEAGIEIRFPDISESGTTLAGIRADQFYGLTLTAAIRNYLERRKASGLGAASVLEIYRAIKDGGYKFGAKNEEIEKISLSNALRKNSSIFHRLPNGQYGLLIWYPTAKAPLDGEESPKPRGKQRPTGGKKASGAENNQVTNREVQDLILAQEGEFQATDIETAVKAKYPSKKLTATKVSTNLFILHRKKGLLRVVSERSGKKGAVYVKA